MISQHRKKKSSLISTRFISLCISDFTSQRSDVVSYHLLDGYSVINLYAAIQNSHHVTEKFVSSSAIICYPHYIKLVFNYKTNEKQKSPNT